MKRSYVKESSNQPLSGCIMTVGCQGMFDEDYVLAFVLSRLAELIWTSWCDECEADGKLKHLRGMSDVQDV